MLTYTLRRNLFGNLANNSSSSVLSLADTLMNDSEKRILASREWPFMEKQFTITTGGTFTVTIASPGIFTLADHGFNVGDIIFLSTTGALPTGLSSGTAYYIISAGLTSSAFEVSTSPGGSAVNTSGTQSGTHSVFPQFYPLPMYVHKVQSVYSTVGNRRFAPLESTSRAHWDRLNEIRVISDIPVWWYQYDNQIALFPRPATATNVITVNAKRLFKDLNTADYSTGTVDVITKDSTSVTGSGTTWSSPMVGRYLRVTESNTASASGDGFWYEISQVNSTTALTLVKRYQGTSLITGASAAYTIGQVSFIPEPYDQIPVFEALRIYFTSVESNSTQAQLYDGMSKELYKQLVESYGSKSSGVVVESGHDYELINPNLTITL